MARSFPVNARAASGESQPARATTTVPSGRRRAVTRRVSRTSRARSHTTHSRTCRNRSGSSVSGVPCRSPPGPYGRPISPMTTSRSLSCIPVRSLDDGVLHVGQELLDGIRGLGALLDPLLGSSPIDLYSGWLGQRVVVPDDLDEPPVPRRPGIRNHHAIRGPPRRTGPPQSNRY